MPAQNTSCFTKSNLRRPSSDCYKVSRSSGEQRRCPMQQKSPATSKEILEKTSRRISQNWFKLILETMCLFLPPELLWASVRQITKHSGAPGKQKVWKQVQDGSAMADGTICCLLSSFWGLNPTMFPQQIIMFPCKINSAQTRDLKGKCSVDKPLSGLSSSCPCSFNLPSCIHARYFGSLDMQKHSLFKDPCRWQGTVKVH